MADSDAVASQIRTAFGKLSLYEILGVTPQATEEEIKKGYKKKALLYHPDKGGDGQKFQALSAVHLILSDANKRRVFDETGTLETEDMSDEATFWYDYFRSMFPKVTTTAIDEFSAKYKGSEEERNDVLNAYRKYKGDVEKMMEVIMLCEEGDEGRIIKIVDDAIALTNATHTKTNSNSSSNSSSSSKKRKGAKESETRKEAEEDEEEDDNGYDNSTTERLVIYPKFEKFKKNFNQQNNGSSGSSSSSKNAGKNNKKSRKTTGGKWGESTGYDDDDDDEGGGMVVILTLV